MEKLLFTLVLLLGVVGNMFAQKEYVTILVDMYADHQNYAYLSGSIPSSMKSKYVDGELGEGDGCNWIGTLLNQLAAEGFIVEQMNTYSEKYRYNSYQDTRSTFLLSRDKNHNSASAKAVKLESYDNANVHEVARYNLQGMAVDATEKGIQIVVYSNYTTKTVIVE